MYPKLKWSAEEFSSFRLKTDPLADNVIRSIISTSETEKVNGIFSHLRDNMEVDIQQLPPIVRTYFEETAILPSWIDQEKIKIGQKVFATYGPEISLCLLCKSLPEAYACANGAKVLYATGRMTEQNGSLNVFTRRLMETAQFVVNVCSPGGLDPKGSGIVTAQKVRLIHAAVRYYIKKHGSWPKAYGEPINQQDMAGTLQSFSTLTLQGLERLDIQLSEEEKEGYYHCWRVAGHIVGLEEELNPPTHQEGLALGEAILADQVKPSAEGHTLTMAVCDFMTEMLPGNIFKHTPEVIIRYLVGDKIAENLQLDDETNLIDKIVPRFMGFLFHTSEEVENKSHFFEKIIQHLNLHLLQGMLNHFNENKQVRFYIPPDLRNDWNLD